MSEAIFHLAFPVHDMAAAKHFYGKLGCELGRETERSLIINLAGHQLVAHWVAEEPELSPQGIYPRHFGLVFHNLEEWQALAERVRQAGLKFYQEPRVRHGGTPVEHRTFFLEDPSHNLLEFKCYKSASAVFGERAVKKVGDME
jgi:extradiol dioxygenase family protein